MAVLKALASTVKPVSTLHYIYSMTSAVYNSYFSVYMYPLFGTSQKNHTQLRTIMHYFLPLFSI